MLREIGLTTSPTPEARVKYVLVAVLTALQLAAPVTGVRAAEFDETMRAPEAPTNAELKKRIRGYFDTYARVNADSAAGIVRDKAAHAKWFETHWRLQRAIDTKRPLGDLSEYGIAPKGGGSYAVDIKRFPQWDPLDRNLARLLNPEVFEAYAAELKQRGFRDHDIDVMRTYVEKNQPRRIALAENLPLAESFAAKTKVRIARKQLIDNSYVLAYTYQNSRNTDEATRVWAVGLLDSLDKQRQRILESFFLEEAGAMAMAPDDVDAQVKWVVDSIASGEYARMLEAEKMEVQQ